MAEIPFSQERRKVVKASRFPGCGMIVFPIEKRGAAKKRHK